VIDTPGGALDVAVDGNGRYVAFTTQERREHFLYFGLHRVAVLDRVNGERAVASTNLQGTVPDDAGGVAGSQQPALDERGTTVGFGSDQSDIVLGDTNNEHDVFTRPLASMFGTDGAPATRASR
jgi:hypothetical protein